MFPGMGELRGHRDLILMLRTGLRDLKKHYGFIGKVLTKITCNKTVQGFARNTTYGFTKNRFNSISIHRPGWKRRTTDDVLTH